jgi:hypothetical protein
MLPGNIKWKVGLAVQTSGLLLNSMVILLKTSSIKLTESELHAFFGLPIMTHSQFQTSGLNIDYE